MENISASFGNKDIFAIEYAQLDEDCWCEFKMWVNNVDICRHQYEGKYIVRMMTGQRKEYFLLK